MTKTWDQVFQPVRNARGLAVRTQQKTMGQAIIDGITNRTNVIVEAPTGTGKSLCALLPSIDYVLDKRTTGVEGRVVVSTATRNLQDQYINDLKSLVKIYDGKFTFCSLKGRDNYLCLDRFKNTSIGNADLKSIRATLERKLGTLTTGERGDVERILGREISNFEWSFLSGSSKYCADNKCKAEDGCFSTKARNIALASNIVITNNAILRVDADTYDGAFSDNFLGPFDILIVDEAHELESSLISGWTEDLNEREIVEMFSDISTAVDRAGLISNSGKLGYVAERCLTDVLDFIKASIEFFGALNENVTWDKVTDVVSVKYVMNNAPKHLVRAMHDYETDRLSYAIDALPDISLYLEDVLGVLDQGNRKISKGLTASYKMYSLLLKMKKALESRNGTFIHNDVPYSVVLNGFFRRNGDRSINFALMPIDISSFASKIWQGRICILMSATLRDLEDNSFRYLRTSLGFPDGAYELTLDTVFNLKHHQLTYITQGPTVYTDHVSEFVPGAQFFMDELVDLIHAAKGRTLVLFTAKRELEFTYDFLKDAGLPYPIYAQTDGVNKDKLGESFKNNENSILLATKSFFQGFDAPGSTLSLVVLVKYPLLQYNSFCKNQIDWWRSRGFPNWYSSRSMEIFHQAAGRVIRNEKDYGVVALLDQRAIVPNSNVYHTASKAVSALQSPVIRNTHEIKRFLV